MLEFARVEPEVFELLEILRLDQLRDVETVGVELAGESLEPVAPLFPCKIAQVDVAFEEDVVEADERWVSAKHLLTDGLSPEPLLERVEACRGAAMLVPEPLV